VNKEITHGKDLDIIIKIAIMYIYDDLRINAGALNGL
jgi:hypothetical protein